MRITSHPYTFNYENFPIHRLELVFEADYVMTAERDGHYYLFHDNRQVILFLLEDDPSFVTPELMQNAVVEHEFDTALEREAYLLETYGSLWSDDSFQRRAARHFNRDRNYPEFQS